MRQRLKGTSLNFEKDVHHGLVLCFRHLVACWCPLGVNYRVFDPTFFVASSVLVPVCLQSGVGLGARGYKRYSMHTMTKQQEKHLQLIWTLTYNWIVYITPRSTNRFLLNLLKYSETLLTTCCHCKRRHQDAAMPLWVPDRLSLRGCGGVIDCTLPASATTPSRATAARAVTAAETRRRRRQRRTKDKEKELVYCAWYVCSSRLRFSRAASSDIYTCRNFFEHVSTSLLVEHAILPITLKLSDIAPLAQVWSQCMLVDTE